MPHKVTRRKKRLAVRRHLVADTSAVPWRSTEPPFRPHWTCCGFGEGSHARG